MDQSLLAKLQIKNPPLNKSNIDEIDVGFKKPLQKPVMANINTTIIDLNEEDFDRDLFLKENLLYCYKKYYKSIDYITGDGGFDFSIDFNNQENISFKLILSQIFFALIMQKEGGNFVLKIFDI